MTTTYVTKHIFSKHKADKIENETGLRVASYTFRRITGKVFDVLNVEVIANSSTHSHNILNSQLNFTPG